MKVHQLSVIDPNDIVHALEEFIEDCAPQEIFNVIPITVAVPKKSRSFVIAQSQQQPEIEYQFRFIIIYE